MLDRISKGENEYENNIICYATRGNREECRKKNANLIETGVMLARQLGKRMENMPRKRVR